MKVWTLYCHIHIESQRRYIGMTSNTTLHRWNQHCSQAKSSKGGRWHFPNAIRKYGKDSFEHIEFPVKYSTLEEANRAEEFAIEFWCTRDRDFGFNLAKGGTCKTNPIRKNPWNNPEYRKKMTEKIREYWSHNVVSIDTRTKIGEKSRGRQKSPNTIEKIRANGSKKTPESLQKMRARLTEFYAKKPYIHNVYMAMMENCMQHA